MAGRETTKGMVYMELESHGGGKGDEGIFFPMRKYVQLWEIMYSSDNTLLYLVGVCFFLFEN